MMTMNKSIHPLNWRLYLSRKSIIVLVASLAVFFQVDQVNNGS